MTFRTKLIPSLATLLLPFAGLTTAASAQTVILPPSTNGTSTTQTFVVGRNGRLHPTTRRHTTKKATTTRSNKLVWHGPLHTKKVADLPSAVPLVWVNIPTGVYHYPGSASYGKTDTGKYMTEQDALKLHYRAAFNNQ